MNRNDMKLVLFLVLFILVFFLLKNINSSKDKVANVYYNDELIKTISLNEDGLYTVLGDNGDVVIEVLDNKIRVIEENSLKNLCSKQGYISESYESIVCLPNRIVININSDDYDAVVK